jgi:hypothetical protein
MLGHSRAGTNSNITAEVMATEDEVVELEVVQELKYFRILS